MTFGNLDLSMLCVLSGSLTDSISFFLVSFGSTDTAFVGYPNSIITSALRWMDFKVVWSLFYSALATTK